VVQNSIFRILLLNGDSSILTIFTPRMPTAAGGGQGESGGTRANGGFVNLVRRERSSLSNTFMCLGEPPRLSPASAHEASGVDRRGGPFEEIPGRDEGWEGRWADFSSNRIETN